MTSKEAIKHLSEPSELIRQETIKELCDWLEQMIQHGVPSYSAKRKALANAIALLSMDTHEIHTETHECVKETHDSDLISRADAVKAVSNYLREIHPTTLINFLEKAYGILNTVPSAERVGEWQRFDDEHGYWIGCSNCKEYIPKDKYGNDMYTDYCPNCGARMENKK